MYYVIPIRENRTRSSCKACVCCEFRKTDDSTVQVTSGFPGLEIQESNDALTWKTLEGSSKTFDITSNVYFRTRYAFCFKTSLTTLKVGLWHHELHRPTNKRLCYRTDVMHQTRQKAFLQFLLAGYDMVTGE